MCPSRATTAVSTRNGRGPRLMVSAPQSRRAVTSDSINPPSGPTTKTSSEEPLLATMSAGQCGLGPTSASKVRPDARSIGQRSRRKVENCGHASNTGMIVSLPCSSPRIKRSRNASGRNAFEVQYERSTRAAPIATKRLTPIALPCSITFFRVGGRGKANTSVTGRGRGGASVHTTSSSSSDSLSAMIRPTPTPPSMRPTRSVSPTVAR